MKVDDVDLSLEYTETAIMSGHLDEAAKVMMRLKGHRATDEQVSRADYLARTLANKVGASAGPERGGGAPSR